jgi:hypothetical protein
MRYSPFTILLIGATLLLSTSLLAQTIRQRSTTEGFNLSLQGHYMNWSSDYFQFLDERSGNGIGFGGRAGFGLTQRYEVFIQYNYTSLNASNIAAQSFHFSHLTPGIRFNFSPTTRALRPYAEVGYAYQTGKVDQVLNQNGGHDNLLFKGGAAHIGAGITYFVSLPIAITLGGSVQVAGKPTVQLNGRDTSDQADLSAYRISLGVVLYLSEL